MRGTRVLSSALPSVRGTNEVTSLQFSASCSKSTLCGRLHSELRLLKSPTEAGAGNRRSSPRFAGAVGDVV